MQAQQTGAYTFTTTSDDGCCLWVNGQLLIDNWDSLSLTTHSATIDLTKDQTYSIRMEYCQIGVTGKAELDVVAPNGTAVSDNLFTHQTQAPTNYLPATASVNQDVALRLLDRERQRRQDRRRGCGIQLLLEVTLSCADGTLTLGSTTGLSFSDGDGVNDATMTFTGTLDNINHALNGPNGSLTFNATAGFKGQASLRIITSDGETNNIADNSLPITVIAVNHAPTIAVPQSATAVEGQVTTFSAPGSNIVINDQDINASSYVNVVNGNFESPNVGVGYYTDQYHGAAPGWNLQPLYWTNSGTVPNSSGLAGNGAEMGNPNSYRRHTSCLYPRRRVHLARRHICQTGNYTISFQSAYREYGGQHTLMVLVDGVSVGTFYPGSSQQFQGYTRHVRCHDNRHASHHVPRRE